MSSSTTNGNWFFGNPREERRKEQLRQEAAADLQAHLQQKSNSPNAPRRQPSVEALTDSQNYGRAVDTRRQSSMPQQQYASSSPSHGRRHQQEPQPAPSPAQRHPATNQSSLASNPLLGIGERQSQKEQRGGQQQLLQQQSNASEQRQQNSNGGARADRRREREDPRENTREPAVRESASREERTSSRRLHRSRSRRYSDDEDDDEAEDYTRSRSRLRARFAPGEAGRSSRSLRSRYYDDGEDDVRGDENIIVRGSRRSLRSREYSSDEDDGAYEDRGERRRRSDDRRAPPQQPQPPAAARSTRGAQSAGGAHASATTFGRDDSGDKSAKASKNNDYAEELRRQMAEKKEREREEKQRRQLEDLKLEKEALGYNPFGKGGAGAPHRDFMGNVITNTKHQAKLNEMAPPGLHSAQYAPAEYESPPPPVPQQFQNSGRRPPGGYTSVSIVSPQANSMSAGPPPVPVRSAREQYQNDLAEQIRLKKEREMQEKARLAEEDLKKEAEMDRYNPFGKVGAGAPLRDPMGNIVPKATALERQLGTVMPAQNQLSPLQMLQYGYPGIDPNLLAQLASQSGMQYAPAPATSGNPIEMLLKQLLSQQAGGAMNPGMAGAYGQNPYQQPAVSFQQPPTGTPPTAQQSALLEATNNVDMSHMRGTVDLSKMAPWQRDEILRKQKMHGDHQEALRKQMEERKMLKDLQVQKEKEEEQREAARLEKERLALEERHKHDNDPAIPMLVAKQKKNAFEFPAEASTTGASGTSGAAPPANNTAADTAAMFLKAKAEAEALKKSKFKGKRVGGHPGDSSMTIAPPPPRAASPPLPTMAKKNAGMDMSIVDEYSVPPSSTATAISAPAQKVVSISQATIAIAEPSTEQIAGKAPARKSSATNQLTDAPTRQEYVERRSISKAPSGNFSQPDYASTAQRKHSLRSSSPPENNQKMRTSSQVDTNNSPVDNKTRTVLEQLSLIKQELEKEREIIQHELHSRRSSSGTPASTRRVVSQGKSAAQDTPEPARAVHSEDRRDSYGQDSGTGSSILDRILASLKVTEEAVVGSASTGGNSVDAILQRQEKRLQQQEHELDSIRTGVEKQFQLKETVKKYNTDNQLESTTSHLPMTGASETKGPKMNILDEPSVPSTPLTRPPRMPSKAAQRNSDHDLMMGEVAGGALSTTSSTNALDLDALDKLNQERLKRLALLESSHELRGNRPRKETNDILDAFMKNELSRATSAETLMADTMLK